MPLLALCCFSEFLKYFLSFKEELNLNLKTFVHGQTTPVQFTNILLSNISNSSCEVRTQLYQTDIPTIRDDIHEPTFPLNAHILLFNRRKSPSLMT